MKKSLFALAALGAFAGSAQAQSSVTLYGVADATVGFTSNLAKPGGGSGNTFSVGSGGLSGSRWGLRGVEEISSDLSAIFALENGFSLDTGTMSQGGRLFGRQAFGGLQSKTAGSLTFGRQYTTMFDALANFSPGAYAGLYEPTFALLGLDLRSDNTVKYKGTFGPWTVGAHWSFGNGVAGGGEVPGQFRRDTGYGAGVTYLAGPFGATVAYDQANPSVINGTTFLGTGSVKKAAVAGSYTVGPAKLMAGYRYGQAKDQSGRAVVRDNMYWVGANYQVTAALGLTVDYFYQDFRPVTAGGITTNPANPWQVMFIADYNLSKRTDVYLTTAYSKYAGLTLDTASINFANGYPLGGTKTNMLGVALGVRHKF
ncbi:porin [Cupriavidus sp. CuC1]|uniref:porin n=1 Tax=Cupriavidus sp. CuC1 TaxID=3373131 RepID=UPI0037CD32C3